MHGGVRDMADAATKAGPRGGNFIQCIQVYAALKHKDGTQINYVKCGPTSPPAMSGVSQPDLALAVCSKVSNKNILLPVTANDTITAFFQQVRTRVSVNPPVSFGPLQVI